MDITELVTEGGSAAYGIKKDIESSDISSSSLSSSTSTSDGTGSSETNSTEDEATKILTTAETIDSFYNQDGLISDIMLSFMSELPVIPICHRTGLMIYSSEISTAFAPSESELYFGIESIKIN